MSNIVDDATPEVSKIPPCVQCQKDFEACIVGKTAGSDEYKDCEAKLAACRALHECDRKKSVPDTQ